MHATDYVLPDTNHKIDQLVLSSKRVSDLRDWMIETVPCLPATKETKDQLRQLSINRLMRVYINWIDRFVPPEKRQPMVWDGFWTRNNPREYADQINTIINKLRFGKDLTPHLSQRIHTHGFVPCTQKRKGINWGDKDMVLNAYDLHHLHLTPATKNGKRKGGSVPLLYVGVSRAEVLLLMLGDHNSFDDGSIANAVAEHRAQAGFVLNGVTGLTNYVTAKESQQLARRGVSTAQMVGDKATIGPMVTSAGTAIDHVRHVDRCCDIIETIEEVIDDRDHLISRLDLAEKDVPQEPDWCWQFYYANLFLVELSTTTGFLVSKWRR